MATLTYGPALPAYGWADTSTIGISQFLTRINSIRFTYESSSEATGDFRLLNMPGFQTAFYGYGLTYNSNGALTGGVITATTSWLDGVLLSHNEGLSVAVTALITWVEYDDYVAAGNSIYGGNDLIYAPTGYSAFNGYGGIDTVVLPDAIRQTTMTGYAPNQASISSADITDNLASVERLQFVDGTMCYDAGSPAAMVVRLYQAALGRPSDPIGLSYWTSMLQRGVPLSQLANGFIGSPEFQARFPGIAQNASAFVTQLYANVLHRAPDAAGLSYWVGQLQGVQSPAQVLSGFSESPENTANTMPQVSAGIWVANEQTASVARLYYSALNRAPDAGGLRYWSSSLQSGSQTLAQEANGFMGSTEFQTKYGALNNSDFVGMLYQNVLGRPADGTGQTYWTNLLASGALNRSSVLVGFSESPEHQSLLMPKIETSGVILS